MNCRTFGVALTSWASLTECLIGADFRDARLAGIMKLDDCIDRMRPTDVQLTAIVDRYLDANPASWSIGMTTTAFAAIAGACKSVGISIF